jgi:hypothetical protein
METQIEVRFILPSFNHGTYRTHLDAVQTQKKHLENLQTLHSLKDNHIQALEMKVADLNRIAGIRTLESKFGNKASFTQVMESPCFV